MTPLLSLELRYEHDVVAARQRTRQITDLLGFDAQDQTRLATAASEIARNAFQYAGGGRVEFAADLRAPRPLFEIRVRDQGPGIADVGAILDGRYRSQTGMGVGLAGTRRLMDTFTLDSTPGIGTTVTFGKYLPKRRLGEPEPSLSAIAGELARQAPQNPFEEIQLQNQELLRALEAVEAREAELAQVNRELSETNRGVVALYAELDQKAEFLQKASEQKSRFLSNMSHEFRTPLGSIINLAQLLESRLDGDLTKEQEKQIGFIRQSAEGLLTLVNDLLDIAKIEAGRVAVRADAFTVADLFGALRGMFRPLLAQKPAVSLIFEEPANVPALHSDEGKVAQILRNFIANAVKFTERGEIRVSAAPAQSGDAVVFSVTDEGIGIAPEDQARIFEEFAQVDGDLQRAVKGTGLGLPLSRKLAELLGGRVFVVSAPGHGATFSAVIPLRYAGPAEASLDAAPSREEPQHV